MSIIQPMLEEHNYEVDNDSSCDTHGNSRNAKISIRWPKPDFYYNLSISFSAVSYCFTTCNDVNSSLCCYYAELQEG